MDTAIHTICESQGSGHLTWDGKHGPAIRSGQRVELLLGGHWIAGRIVKSSWDTKGPFSLCFMAEDNSVCGLMQGMQVRREQEQPLPIKQPRPARGQEVCETWVSPGSITVVERR